MTSDAAVRTDLFTSPAFTPASALTTQERDKLLRRLVDDHFDFIWRSLRGLGVPQGSADDATQQVFLIASQKLDAIVPGSERSFLFGTAMRVAANERRGRARRREVSDDDAIAAQADDVPDPEQLTGLRQARARLDETLSAMSEDLRVVFVLFELEGLSTVEIAHDLGIARGTAASRLRRARDEFRAITTRLEARRSIKEST